MAEFRMPSLGADMESGVLLEWLVQPGDQVHKGDIIAVIDTAKAAVDVECFDSGTVERLLVQPGTRVAVGTPLASIATATGATEASAPASVAVPAAAASPRGEPLVSSPLVRHVAESEHVDVTTVHGTGFGGRITRADVLAAARGATKAAPTPGRVRASPLARRLATELGVDLAAVTGTGRNGVVEADDVRRATAARPQPAVERPSDADRTAAMREAIAALMARSKREIPHYYLTETVDLGPAMDWLRACNRDLPVSQRLVPAVMLLKAAARAAREVPDLNGYFVDGHATPADAVHVGVAVSLRGGGLVAPAIHHADQLDLIELMARLKDLVTRTRAGRLRRAELADPTITVSNLGEQGVETILGVIYPPQVALVGFGRIVTRPWAVGNLIGVRPLVTVSLAADHRVTDGATGARYLAIVNQHLQRPEEL